MCGMSARVSVRAADQAAAVTWRRAERARSMSTAAVAATSAAPIAIRAICQPGVPPTTTVWSIGAGCAELIAELIGGRPGAANG